MSYAKTLLNTPNKLSRSQTPTKHQHALSTSVYTNSHSQARTAATYGLQSQLSPVTSPFQQSQFSPEPQNLNKSTVPQPFSSSLLSTRHPKLDEVHQKYEREAQNVQRQYERHYEDTMVLGNSILDMQALLDVECRKTADLRAQLDDAYKSLEQEKRTRLDGDRENRDLREKVRRLNFSLTDYEQKVSNVQQNATSVSHENDGWRSEVKKLNDTCNFKIKEMETIFNSEKKLLEEQVDELRSLIKDREVDNETKIRGVTRDLEAKIRSLENQAREKDRIIEESESQLKSFNEFNMKVKMGFEEEVKKRAGVVKDEEKTRHEGIIKQLEGRVAELETELDLLRRNSQDVGQDLRNKEGLVRDAKMKYEEQVRALRREVLDLKDKISLDMSEIERLQGELRGKDPVIAKLQQEIQTLNNEIANNKETYVQEVNRLAVRNDNDVRRFQEFERQLKGRIKELEKQLKDSESEVGKLKTDLEKLRQNVAGNIQKTIAMTFVDYGLKEQPIGGGRSVF